MSVPQVEIQEVTDKLMLVAQLLDSYEFKFINGMEQNMASGIYPSKAQERRAREILLKYDEHVGDEE